MFFLVRRIYVTASSNGTSSMRSWRVEDRLDEGSLYHAATKIDQPMDLGIFPEFFRKVP